MKLEESQELKELKHIILNQIKSDLDKDIDLETYKKIINTEEIKEMFLNDARTKIDVHEEFYNLEDLDRKIIEAYTEYFENVFYHAVKDLHLLANRSSVFKDIKAFDKLNDRYYRIKYMYHIDVDHMLAVIKEEADDISVNYNRLFEIIRKFGQAYIDILIDSESYSGMRDILINALKYHCLERSIILIVCGRYTDTVEMSAKNLKKICAGTGSIQCNVPEVSSQSWNQFKAYFYKDNITASYFYDILNDYMNIVDPYVSTGINRASYTFFKQYEKEIEEVCSFNYSHNMEKLCVRKIFAPFTGFLYMNKSIKLFCNYMERCQSNYNSFELSGNSARKCRFVNNYKKMHEEFNTYKENLNLSTIDKFILEVLGNKYFGFNVVSVINDFAQRIIGEDDRINKIHESSMFGVIINEALHLPDTISQWMFIDYFLYYELAFSDKFYESGGVWQSPIDSGTAKSLLIEETEDNQLYAVRNVSKILVKIIYPLFDDLIDVALQSLAGENGDGGLGKVLDGLKDYIEDKANQETQKYSYISTCNLDKIFNERNGETEITELNGNTDELKNPVSISHNIVFAENVLKYISSVFSKQNPEKEKLFNPSDAVLYEDEITERFKAISNYQDYEYDRRFENLV